VGWHLTGRSETPRRVSLGLTNEEFEDAHVAGLTPAGEKLIKRDLQVCQFPGEDRKCIVYEVRRQRCRSYHWWEAHNLAIYKFAAPVQESLAQLPDGM